MASNISFRRGLHNDLFKTGVTYADGAFYLTTDSHRLFVGQKISDSENGLFEINRYIKDVADTAALFALSGAKNGDFVYVIDGNMLVVCTDETKSSTVAGWTQVNAQAKDTNTDQWLEYVDVTSSDQEDSIIKTINFKLHNKDVAAGTETTSDIAVPIEITKENITNLVDYSLTFHKTSLNEIEVALQNTVTDSQKGSFNLVEGDNITFIQSDANSLTISASSYSIGSPTGSSNITLFKDNKALSENVELVAYNDDIVIDGADVNQIGISHKTINSLKTENDINISGNSFTALTDVTIENGHITGYTKSDFTLPENNDTIISTIVPEFLAPTEETNKGKFKIDIIDSENITHTGTAEGLFYKINGEKVYNQEDLANSTYLSELKDSVKSLEKNISNLDALMYKGTVGDSTATVPNLPTSNVKIGDTYKVAKEGKFAGENCKVGDLLIATGAEDENGYITSETLTWTIVASGAETDTTYTLSGEGNVIKLIGSTGEAGSIAFSGGDYIDGEIANGEIKINHKKPSKISKTNPLAQNLNSGETFSVPTYTFDDWGHLVHTGTKEFVLPEDKDTLYSFGATTVSEVDSSSIKLSSILTNSSNENSSATEHIISSNSLKLTANSTGYSIDLEWGTF